MQVQLCQKSPRDPGRRVGSHWLGWDRADAEPFPSSKAHFCRGSSAAQGGWECSPIHHLPKMKRCWCTSGLFPVPQLPSARSQQLWGALPYLQAQCSIGSARLPPQAEGSGPLSSPGCALCKFLMTAIKHKLHCSAG